jgi:hypothetical protein
MRCYFGEHSMLLDFCDDSYHSNTSTLERLDQSCSAQEQAAETQHSDYNLLIWTGTTKEC